MTQKLGMEKKKKTMNWEKHNLTQPGRVEMPSKWQVESQDHSHVPAWMGSMRERCFPWRKQGLQDLWYQGDLLLEFLPFHWIKSAWVKGQLLWRMPCPCWASCSCPCLWSIPRLGRAGQHHWRWRWGWELAAAWFFPQPKWGQEHLDLLAAVGRAKPVDFTWACLEAQSAAKKGQLGVSISGSKPLFGKRTHNIYQLLKRYPHCFLGGNTKGHCSLGSQEEHVSSWWKSGGSSSDLSGAVSQLSKPGCVKSPSGHPAKNILHLKVIFKKISSFGVRELLNPEIQDELKDQVFNPKLHIWKSKFILQLRPQNTPKLSVADMKFQLQTRVQNSSLLKRAEIAINILKSFPICWVWSDFTQVSEGEI